MDLVPGKIGPDSEENLIFPYTYMICFIFLGDFPY